MPGGIPVAAVAIDGAENAAILAAEILSLYDSELTEKLLEKREEMAAAVNEQDREIQQHGKG
jgi:5-(carboxyamino)imidazole ribonucleotide mutase